MTSAFDSPAQTTAYHITPASRVDSIMHNGLVPAIGPRSAAAGEQEAFVYLFRSLLDAEDALMNWLGDAFDDDSVLLAILEVDASGLPLTSTAGFELVCRGNIPPARVRLIGHA